MSEETLHKVIYAFSDDTQVSLTGWLDHPEAYDTMLEISKSEEYPIEYLKLQKYNPVAEALAELRTLR